MSKMKFVWLLVCVIALTLGACTPRANWRRNQEGKPHPDMLAYPNLVGGKIRGTWEPAPGYTWANPELAYSLEVKWVPGEMSDEMPGWVAGSIKDEWQLLPGYTLVNPDDPKDFETRWTPGLPHSFIPNVIAGKKRNSFIPADGYKWAPGDKWGVCPIEEGEE